MLTTLTLRNVGAAAIVVGLLIALYSMGPASDRPLVLAWLLVLVGIGLRLEAAVRGRDTRLNDAEHPRS
ncbi:hypothetical protein WEI85_38150 [Actinomycetes bacterium KLBMP 9797]